MIPKSITDMLNYNEERIKKLEVRNQLSVGAYLSTFDTTDTPQIVSPTAILPEYNTSSISSNAYDEMYLKFLLTNNLGINYYQSVINSTFKLPKFSFSWIIYHNLGSRAYVNSPFYFYSGTVSSASGYQYIPRDVNYSEVVWDFGETSFWYPHLSGGSVSNRAALSTTLTFTASWSGSDSDILSNGSIVCVDKFNNSSTIYQGLVYKYLFTGIVVSSTKPSAGYIQYTITTPFNDNSIGTIDGFGSEATLWFLDLNTGFKMMVAG